MLTKGLAALLVQSLSDRPVEEVMRVSPGFVVLIGLQQSLTPSRNNEFLNMLKLMHKKALQLYMESEKGDPPKVHFEEAATEEQEEKLDLPDVPTKAPVIFEVVPDFGPRKVMEEPLPA
ncbi:unnamed protein product [Fraxinus pennsylvanica]|uniref:Fe-S metabolism associated domain-containing protein n=1 Tax=Fraxinus pennsylvanica TaxID=56036 RepID=A0AAD1YP97_9LAMI|nr:unnamed protein product [Fraxinus pennsylvanica]